MSKRLGKSRVAVLAVLTLLASLLSIVLTTTSASAGGSPCGASVNPIACENRQTGTPEDVWDVTGAGDSTIQGFATDISVNAGATVDFKVSTDASAYQLEIYRLGWYGGDGARHVATVLPSATLPQTQPACATDPSVGLVDCGTWSVSASWAVPSTAVSGVYIADLVRTDTGGKSQVPFVVRNDASTAAIAYQTSDPTWEAYNRYGNSDFYTGTAGNLYDSPSRGRQISYNRPFATRADQSGQDYLFSNEYPTIRFLERNGYDVTYLSGVDTDRYGASLLTNHKVFMSVGHDEYWSQAQRTNVEHARDAGVNLMFLSGNEVFWHTRYAPSIDGSSTAYRTLICYKQTWDNSATDPSGESTATWRDPRFSAAPGGTNPENALTGTIYMSNSTDLPLTVTAAQGKLRMWRNTGLASMSGSSTVIGQHIIGYESDEDLDNGFRNAGQIDLSTTTGATSQYLQDFGRYSAPGTTTHHITLYRAASKALVFGAGTIQWGWGLDSDHDGAPTSASPQMQQFMVNLLADMSAQPQTLMTGLVAASASSDTTAPTSAITGPGAGQTVSNGTQLTVTGTASDVGGSVAGVEVSIDGGATWHEANGTTSWTYTGLVHGNGSLQLLSRATDDSMNTETPAAGVTVTSSCPCSLFGQSTPSMPDSGDAGSVTLGVRFSTTTSGYVTGVRFYKAATNTGTHTGSLWTAGGTLLATGTFSNETASGWQTLQFASPVAVGANTTYVAGYWAPSGHYSETDMFFYYRTYAATPLKAQSNSATDASKKNGLYATGNAFPGKTYLGANYYVDPLFVPAANGIPSVTSTTPDADATGVDPAVSPTATFTSAMDPATISFTLSGPVGRVEGAVSYDATSKTVTFNPTEQLSSGTTYQASVSGTGTNGTAMIAPNTWSFKVAGNTTCPCTLFPTGSEPGVADSGDGAKISLGTTFTPSVSGYVTGARFFKSAANTGVHTASLWTTDGTRLATSTFGNETATGWQVVSFSPAVAVTAGTSYIVSYYAPKGHYAEDDHYFDSALVNAPLSAPIGAGVYAYGTDQFPSSSYANANYWVDPVFDTQTGSSAPSVTAQTPAPGETGVDPATSVTATFSDPVKPNSVAFSVSSSDGPVAGTTTYNSGTNTATFTPSTALAASTNYTAQVSATGSNGVTMTAPASWSFTTISSCPCSLFSASTAPTTVDSADGSAVTLGVKFSSAEPGTISGIRFYKAASNTGTHVGALWSADGTMLASATFADESDTGWQTVSFASPVTITAGTTYVASYTAPNGHYSEDANYFAGPLTSGPLTAPSAASVYAVGTSAFPASSYANANYWVDVVFNSTASSGGGTTPPPTPPTVTATTPTDGATGVALSAKPSATFSAAMQGSGLTMTLTGPAGSVGGTVRYDSASQTATFTPRSPLAYATTYTASVAGTGANGAVMSAPKTWSFTTMPDATPPVISAVSATESGTGFTVTWTTDEAATTRVDYGTSATSLTSTASGAASVTSHSVSITGIAANTRYYFRVTSADAVGNSSTSPAAGNSPATYAPAIAPLVDTAVSDFAAGTVSASYVASNGDGEVILKPAVVNELAGTTLPSSLTSTAVVTGGKTTVANGVATVSGARLRSSSSYGSGRSLDALATLRTGQSLGWISTLSTTVQMSFSVNSSQQLIATVNDGGSNVASSVVATSWTPAMHTYSVRWTSSAATFLVDGAQVFTNPFATLYGTSYRPQFLDPVTTDAGLVLDWERLAPFAASGTFTSRVLDGQAAVAWDSVSCDAMVPSGTTLAVLARTGPSATPGTGWTGWKSLGGCGATVGVTARYLQYRLTMTSTGSLFDSPTVRSVTVTAHV